MQTKSFNTFLENITIKPHELALFRVWLVILIFYIPMFGYLLIYSNPNAIDFMSHRYLLSFVALILLFASFFSKWIQKYLVLLVYNYNFIVLTWVIWVVYMNNFSPNYSIGLFLTIVCTGVMMRNLQSMILLYMYSLIAVIYTFYLLPQTEIDKYIYFVSLLGLLIVNSSIMYQRNLMSKELVIANKELSYRNVELEQFAYVVSHDLKAPLRTIGSFASLLKRRMKTANQESIFEYIDFINNGVKQMSNVINDLLAYSTVGHQKINFGTTNVKTIVNELANVLLNNPSNKNVVLKGIEQLPNTIVANPVQIKQIYQNLITNSIKYNDSLLKEITLDFEETTTHWIFSVADNGIGIDTEYHKKVFQLFKRLHSVIEYEGTGLGLAICKRIVERHRGTIELKSVLEQGTTVQFSISKGLKVT